MTLFRLFLASIILVIAVYTGFVIAEHGMGLIPIFFGDMLKMGWPGQFNLDFFCFLLLSGFWVAWRHQFSPSGLLLGVGAVFLGAPYLCTYLIIQSYRLDGDVQAMLMGEGRVNAER